MEINLTLAQWEELRKLVRQGRRAEQVFGTVTVENNAISIEVKDDGVDIILSD